MPPLLIVLTKWNPLADPNAPGYWTVGSDGHGTVLYSNRELKGDSLIDFRKALEVDKKLDEIYTVGLYVAEKDHLEPDLLKSYNFRETNHPKYPYQFQTIWKGKIAGFSSRDFRELLKSKLCEEGFKHYAKRLDTDYFIFIEDVFQQLIEFLESKCAVLSKPSEERKPKFKCLDGHWVRSKAERNIDDWLYEHEYLHAYEYPLPFEERGYYCDFYLPRLHLYIEYWGLSNDKNYLQRMEMKKKLYKSKGLNLIELEEKDLENLDEALGRKLKNLKYINDIRKSRTRLKAPEEKYSGIRA